MKLNFQLSKRKKFNRKLTIELKCFEFTCESSNFSHVNWISNSNTKTLMNFLRKTQFSITNKEFWWFQVNDYFFNLNCLFSSICSLNLHWTNLRTNEFWYKLVCQTNNIPHNLLINIWVDYLGHSHAHNPK